MRKGRVLAIVPLLLVSVHLLLLLYPFTCDQPQFCETELKESTGNGFSRKNIFPEKINNKVCSLYIEVDVTTFKVGVNSPVIMLKSFESKTYFCT